MQGLPPPPPPAGFLDSNALSFEQRIALSLQGANWQALNGGQGVGVGVTPSVAIQEEISDEVEELEVDADLPPQQTAKQKKKKAEFDRVIARDTGAVLATIEPEALSIGPQEVTWDKDPELLCCYNWQDFTNTNTIFGKFAYPLSTLHS